MFLQRAFHACTPARCVIPDDNYKEVTKLASALQRLVGVAATRHVPNLVAACQSLAADLFGPTSDSRTLGVDFFSHVLCTLLLVDPAEERRMSQISFGAPPNETRDADTGRHPIGLPRQPPSRFSQLLAENADDVDLPKDDGVDPSLSVKRPQTSTLRVRATLPDNITAPLWSPAVAAASAPLPANISECSLNASPVANTTEAIVRGDVPLTVNDSVLQVNQYIFLRRIGRGSQGDVFLARDTETQMEVAVKVVQRPRRQLVGAPSAALRSRLRKVDRLDMLRREILIMKQCRHANLLALYEVIDDEQHDEIFLVMQYMKRGVIVKVDAEGCANRAMSALEVASVGRQLCAGLAYLHRHGVAHCDIKPDNILVDEDGTPALCDFGISRLFQSTAGDVGRSVGSTFAFLPPEAMSSLTSVGEPFGASDNDMVSIMAEAHAVGVSLGVQPAQDAQWSQLLAMEADVWALGLSLYVMLFGRLPVPLNARDGTDPRTRYAAAVASRPIPFTPPSRVDPGGSFDQVVDVLRGMLEPRPEDRSTAGESHDAFRQLTAPSKFPLPRLSEPPSPSPLRVPSPSTAAAGRQYDSMSRITIRCHQQGHSSSSSKHSNM